MSMNDLLSDSITRIRNGQSAHLSNVAVHNNKLIRGFLDVLVKEGYIVDFSVIEEGNKSKIDVRLKYSEGKKVISEIKRVSTPGRREYSAIANLPKVKNGLGIYVVSTSSGIMSDFEARRQNVGGEILCSVY